MKRIPIAVLILSALGPGYSRAQIRWADVYKSGPVKLVPDPSFGQGVDWGGFLFEGFKEIAVADEGTIFMANSREHTIHKFDPEGRKVQTFGRRGQGPGDLESPASLSILDGRYLVVGEYPLSHRISLFDLNGRFTKLLKTQRPVYDVVALSGTKIAYLAQQFEDQGAARGKQGVQSIPMTVRVILLDIETGAEKVILTRTMSQKFIFMSSGGSVSFGNDLIGRVCLARTADGNLAAAFTGSQQVDIYDSQGTVLRSFSLRRPPRPVTPGYIARYKKAQLAALRKDVEKLPGRGKVLDEIERLDFSGIFEPTLPCFVDMATDADGNFLFFHRAEAPGEPCPDFSVHSPRGDLIAETRLDPDAFDVEIDYRFRRLVFSKSGLIGLAPPKSDEDQLPVLFRVVPGPEKAR